MITTEAFSRLALAFPESTKAPHFEKNSFRVKKKIFATLDQQGRKAVLKLTEIQQSVYGAWDQTACYAVPNKWGKQGWTMVELDKIDEEFAQDILKAAYCNVAPVKLVREFGS